MVSKGEVKDNKAIKRGKNKEAGTSMIFVIVFAYILTKSQRRGNWWNKVQNSFTYCPLYSFLDTDTFREKVKFKTKVYNQKAGEVLLRIFSLLLIFGIMLLI